MKYLLGNIFIVFLVAGFAVQGYGQRFGAGINGGLTATKVSGDHDPLGGRPKLGLYGSVFTNYPVTNHSTWQLELMYIQKGSRAFKDETEPDNIYRDYKFDLHYIEIPVIYQLELSRSLNMVYVEDLIIEAGMSFAKVIGHYEEDGGLDITDREAERKPFNAGEANILLGLYYPISDNIRFHFRFSQGVTPVRPHGPEGGDSRNLLQWFNQFGQYNTAYTFGLSYNISSWQGGSDN